MGTPRKTAASAAKTQISKGTPVKQISRHKSGKVIADSAVETTPSIASRATRKRLVKDEKPAVEPIKIEPPVTPSALKVAELKEQLTSRGLSPHGLKKDLVTRLEDALAKEHHPASNLRESVKAASESEVSEDEATIKSPVRGSKRLSESSASKESPKRKSARKEKTSLDAIEENESAALDENADFKVQEGNNDAECSNLVDSDAKQSEIEGPSKNQTEESAIEENAFNLEGKGHLDENPKEHAQESKMVEDLKGDKEHCELNEDPQIKDPKSISEDENLSKDSQASAENDSLKSNQNEVSIDNEKADNANESEILIEKSTKSDVEHKEEFGVVGKSLEIEMDKSDSENDVSSKSEIEKESELESRHVSETLLLKSEKQPNTQELVSNVTASTAQLCVEHKETANDFKTKSMGQEILEETIDFSEDMEQSEPKEETITQIVDPKVHQEESTNLEIVNEMTLVSNIIHISGFLRPFTLHALKEMLHEYGDFDNFWMDGIKTHCFVQFADIKHAEACRDSLDGRQWPAETGRTLMASFSTEEAFRSAVEEEEEKNGQSKYKSDHEPIRTTPQTEPTRLRNIDRMDSSSRSNDYVPLEQRIISKGLPVDQPKGLDELFFKTEATPALYYLPNIMHRDMLKARNKGSIEQ